MHYDYFPPWPRSRNWPYYRANNSARSQRYARYINNRIAYRLLMRAHDPAFRDDRELGVVSDQAGRANTLMRRYKPIWLMPSKGVDDAR